MRRLLGFPPFTRLLRLVFRSAVPQAAEVAADAGARILAKRAASDVEILGPAECPLNMVGGNYRYQILLRSSSIKSLQEAAKNLVWGYKTPKDVYIEVDVDPVNMM